MCIQCGYEVDKGSCCAGNFCGGTAPSFLQYIMLANGPDKDPQTKRPLVSSSSILIWNSSFLK